MQRAERPRRMSRDCPPGRTRLLSPSRRDAIDLFVARDYDGLAALFGEPAPAASDFEKAARAAEDVGGFESYGDVSFAHYDGGADGVAAIVVQQAHCENDDLVYSVGIAEDGRLVGFRIS